jgi:hypothetical protein
MPVMPGHATPHDRRAAQCAIAEGIEAAEVAEAGAKAGAKAGA